jgi:hypothetical protein
MAQTGFTPIQLYFSSTTTNVPLAANLAGGELAINITDGKLFYKDNANAVQVIGWKTVPTSAGGTGLTSYTQGDLLYYNSGTTLTALAKSATATRYLSNTGSNNNPAWAQIDLTNGVTGDLPYSNLAQGSALSVLGVTGNATADVASIAAGTDNQVLRRSGTSLAFGAVNLASTDAVTGTLPVGNGGTGNTTGAATAVKSNATTGLMEIAGPATGTTRVMTIPNANFTAARTDAGNTFTGNQTFNLATDVSASLTSQTSGWNVGVNRIIGTNSSTGNDNVTKTFSIPNYGALIFISASDGSGGLYFARWNSATITTIQANANVVLSNSPASNQLGLFKNANSEDVSIKQGSSFSSLAGSWFLGLVG